MNEPIVVVQMIVQVFQLKEYKLILVKLWYDKYTVYSIKKIKPDWNISQSESIEQWKAKVK